MQEERQNRTALYWSLSHSPQFCSCLYKKNPCVKLQCIFTQTKSTYSDCITRMTLRFYVVKEMFARILEVHS